jgi:hypothetical protein
MDNIEGLEFRIFTPLPYDLKNIAYLTGNDGFYLSPRNARMGPPRTISKDALEQS